MTMKINKKWTEIIGLPGVGKTRYVKKNLNKLKKQYHIIDSKNHSYFVRFKYLFFFLKLFNLLDDKRFLKKISYRLSVRPLFNANKVLFYDSGILQVLVENLIESNFYQLEKKLNLFYKFSLPGNVIFIEDNLKNIIDREINRRKRRFKINKKELTVRYSKALKFIQEKLIKEIPTIVKVDIKN